MIKTIHNLVYILLLGIFFFNFPEYAFSLNIIPVRIENIPIYLKIGKDVILSIIILLSLIRIIRSRKIFKIQVFFLILLFYITICCFLTQDKNLCISGLRWIMPLIFVGAIYPYINEFFIQKITRLLFILLIVQVSTQCIELFVMPPVQGVNALGLANRVPGLFYISNTASVFVIFTYFLIKYFERKQSIRRVGTILSIISLLLMMSSTGTFIFIITFFFDKYYHSKFFKLFLLISPIIIYILFTNLDTLTGRSAGNTATSGSIRLSILNQCLNETSLISFSFGEATNTAVNLNLKNAFIADSNIISLYHNLGLLGFIPCLFFYIHMTATAWLRKKKDLLIFLIIYLLSSIPVILFEIFPANIISSILLAYYIKRETSKIKETTNKQLVSQKQKLSLT